MKLSIVIPVYNEERLVGTLLGLIARLALPTGVEKEIVVVDDGSADASAAAVDQFIHGSKSTNILFLHHDRNRGKGAAVRTGIEAASGEIIIVQDSDLEYDPADIPRVIAPILAGVTRVSYGSRILREKELARSGFLGLVTGKHPHSYVLAYFGGVAITQWINLLTGAALTDEPTCYKCFHKDALAGICIENNDFAWEPEITMKLLTSGETIIEVPISYHPRKNHDGKKIRWQDGVKALLAAWKYRKKTPFP